MDGRCYDARTTARLAVTIAFLFTLAVRDASAADRVQIASLNVVFQGALTTVTAAVQGHIHRPSDVVRAFASGAASGFGMYQAKSLIGKGHVTGGWLLANAAGSVSENAAAGKHPLAQLGYSIGPFRIRVTVPHFDASADSYAYVDVSGFETFAFLYSLTDHFKMELRSGMIVFTRDDSFRGFQGSTAGIFPRLTNDSDEVWFHEAIHAVQSLQGDVLEPSIGFLTHKPTRKPTDAKSIVRFEYLKVGFMNMANLALFNRGEYDDRWLEIEAYRLGLERTLPSIP